jgi:hypothetical protein
MEMKMADALVVDRKGLARKFANRPKAFIINELLQNGWDENITRISVIAEMLAGRPVCRIVVEDDCPEGFQDLASVYTLFRDSKKADDPTKRGRFELGEKLVIALAQRLVIRTTKGEIVFEGDERTHYSKKRAAGTVVELEVKMTRAEFDDLCSAVNSLLVPEDIVTMFNGKVLEPRKPMHTFETALQTVRVDGEGQLKTTERFTEVNVYEVREGETAHIYEMGLPVVETGDKWHYDIQQKVPVNWERNNVPPSYLKTLRVEVLNAMHDKVSKAEATATWVTQAVEDERVNQSALKDVVVKRFGEKSVVFDPSDSEANKIAMSQGYTVIPGGTLSKGTWENVRRFGAVLPAGQVTPSPKVYDPDGHPENVIDPVDWTPDMIRRADFTMGLFNKITGAECRVVIVKEPHVSWTANFGHGRCCLNYGRLGKRWFALPNRAVDVLDLLVHEFVHHKVHDHLSEEMHKTATLYSAILANLCLDEPAFFKEPT